MQIIPFEINLRKKWSLASIYSTPSHKDKYFIWYLTHLLDFYSLGMKNLSFLVSFNTDSENKAMKDFLYEHTFYNIMKENTCFNGDRCSCIDLLIANSKFSFMKKNSFVWIIITCFSQRKFEKFEPKKLIYQFQIIW